MVRISWSHSISASSRQGGENVQLGEDPYFLLFLRQCLERKAFVVFMLENVVIIFLKTCMDPFRICPSKHPSQVKKTVFILHSLKYIYMISVILVVKPRI